MSRESDTRVEKARKAFRRQMILTLAEVAELIDGSIHTARRRLKEWGVLNSYNQNGRYYTLPDVPDFDANGLWQRRGVFFSRYGTLKQTVVELVRRSQAGLDAGEMRALLGLDPRSFLSAFAHHPQLRREKTKGRFVYFCSDEAVCDKQRQNRWALNAMGRQPTPFQAVAILVEKIKRPALSNEALSRRLRKQNVSVEPEIIQNLFARHNLTVKKTPRSV
jgi:hypothetical protein